MMWGFDPDWLETGPTHGEVLEDLRARRMYPEQPDFQDYKRQRLDLYTTLIDTHEELLYLPNERVIRVVISPHPLGGLIFINEDVTDRLTLERSYNTLIAVQSETLNNLHEGIAVYGADSCLKLFNPAFSRIWRLDPALLREEPRMAEVVDAAKDLFRYQGSWESFREQIIANSADRTARAGRFERADGSILDYAAVPLPDGAMLFTYIDVTDSVTVHRALRERNEALVAADRLKSEFITNVSYELRTPLNTIIGFTEILVRQYFGTLNRRQMEYGEGILEASRQLLALIDDILDLALIEAGRLELDLVPTDIAKMVDAVAALTREHARKVGIVLVVDCDRNIGVFTADERRIKQALFNLVSNAIKYTPSGGRIVILARRDKDGVMLAVRDTGSGIAEEYRDRVFEKFERGHGGDGHGGDGHGGVGLGLALVKSFVLLHGGEVTLESTVGKGTCVTLWLPATPPAERPRLTEGRALWADTGSDA
jgi:signal transduction histidine kinase